MPKPHRVSNINILPHKKHSRLIWTLFIWWLCTSPWVIHSQWDLVKLRGTLRYGTQVSLLSYFKNNDSTIGFEYQLLKTFCENNNLVLEPLVYTNNKTLFNDLTAGVVDLAGGHLTITPKRLESFKFSQPISTTSVSLVTHFGYRTIESLLELVNARGALLADSSYLNYLNLFNYPNEGNINIAYDQSLFDLINQINSKTIDFTLGDSEIISIYQNFIPGLYTPIQIADNQKVAFMARPKQTDELLKNLNQFIVNAEQKGLLTRFKNDLLQFVPEIDTANTVTFFEKLKTKWPQVSDWIYEEAKAMNFDPMLLAAMSYQESHWEVDATSITGVKGLMMLTRSTAEELNISDRTDPIQSLRGGILYFRKMKEKLPERILDPDRTKFALAAYNVGYAHLEDARILTQRNGKNPDLWNDVKTFLPQLNNPKIAHSLQYGSANGRTARTYVENIMIYRSLMSWQRQKEGQKAL